MGLACFADELTPTAATPTYRDRVGVSSLPLVGMASDKGGTRRRRWDAR
jgi:hypothetical protein